MGQDNTEMGGSMSLSDSRRLRTRLRTLAQGYQGFGVLLTTIVATVVAAALVAPTGSGSLLLVALAALSLVVAVEVTMAGPRIRRLGRIAALVAIALVALATTTGDDLAATAAYYLLMSAMVVLVPIAIALRLREFDRVTVQMAIGALCIYLLVGLFFSLIYSALQHYTGEFFASGPAQSVSDFVYFSFVTLATVGYGDLVAGTDVGRLFAIFEALIGQLYLVTVVAIIVSNLGRSMTPGQRAAIGNPHRNGRAESAETSPDTKHEQHAAPTLTDEVSRYVPADGLALWAARYAQESDARSDFAGIRELHHERVLGEYDAALFRKSERGLVKIVSTEESPRAKAAWGGAVVGAVLGLIFPPTLLLTASGAGVGAILGHLSGGIARDDIKEVGEMLDAGEWGIVLISEPTEQADVGRLMAKAQETICKTIETNSGELAKAMDQD